MKKKPSIKPGAVVEKFRSGNDVVVFRYLKRSDLREALKYINSLVREKTLVGTQTKKTMSDEKKWISSSLKSMKEGKGVTIVVEVNGRFMCTSSVTRQPLDANSHVCFISIGLNRESHGMGIGTELMKTLIQQGRDVLGCRIAQLSVYEPNSVAKKLYEKLGFRAKGRIPEGCRYYGKYYDDIIMVREI